MKKSMIYRVLIYIAGLLILAMGLTLNTKAGLGVSPIISVSYSVSEITHHNFGNTTLVLYTIFVILELFRTLYIKDSVKSDFIHLKYYANTLEYM